jgi:predicted aspartyl protease
MYLEGVINGVGVLVLVDSGLTHNVIDINVTHSIGLQEQRINTTILVGSGNKETCRAASFNVPLCIDSDAFDIDAYLLNINYDFDVILGTTWLASLGHVVFDFTDMELQYIHNGRKHTFHATLHR